MYGLGLVIVGHSSYLQRVMLGRPGGVWLPTERLMHIYLSI